MPDYQKSKIYKIWDNNYTECYVGRHNTRFKR